MPVSKRVRFDVFKRDDFACQYCGRRTPNVTLEADHIVPKAEGGGDEFENLITACVACNRGKGREPLESTRANADLAERTALLREREEQIRAYNDVLAESRKRQNGEIVELQGHWILLSNKRMGYDPRRELGEATLRYWLRTMPAVYIEEAMEIAMEKCGDWHGVPYTIGILKNWRDHGRVQ